VSDRSRARARGRVAGACDFCPSGTFAANAGSSACAARVVGTTSASGSSACAAIAASERASLLFAAAAAVPFLARARVDAPFPHTAARRAPRAARDDARERRRRARRARASAPHFASSRDESRLHQSNISSNGFRTMRTRRRDDDDRTARARAMTARAFDRTFGRFPARARDEAADWTPREQRSAWDCGLSAAASASGTPRDALRRALRARSCWTIDLLRAVRATGARATLVTTRAGVDPRYANDGFYENELIKDCERVARLFARADASTVVRARMRAEDIARALSTRAVRCVALVDARLLTAREGERERERDFVGHFVVVRGADVDGGRVIRFRIFDPAPDGGDVMVSRARFDEARTAFGTDEDLLFVETRSSRSAAAA